MGSKNVLLLGTAATLLLALINGILLAMSLPGLVVATLLGPAAAVWWAATRQRRGLTVREGAQVGALTGLTGALSGCLIALLLIGLQVQPSPLEGFDQFTVPQREERYRGRGLEPSDIRARIEAERNRVATFSKPQVLLGLSTLAGLGCGAFAGGTTSYVVRRRLILRAKPKAEA